MHLKSPWTGRHVMVAAFALANFLYANSARSQTHSPAPTSSADPAGKPTPTPTPHHEAPTGVYYLIEDTVVPLKHGLRGIPAGTEVRLVKDNGSTLQVTEGEDEFTTKKSQVTNDLDVAASIRQRTAAINALNEGNLQQQEAILVKQQQNEVEFLRTHPLATPTPSPSPQGQR